MQDQGEDVAAEHLRPLLPSISLAFGKKLVRAFGLCLSKFLATTRLDRLRRAVGMRTFPGRNGVAALGHVGDQGVADELSSLVSGFVGGGCGGLTVGIGSLQAGKDFRAVELAVTQKGKNAAQMRIQERQQRGGWQVTRLNGGRGFRRRVGGGLWLVVFLLLGLEWRSKYQQTNAEQKQGWNFYVHHVERDPYTKPSRGVEFGNSALCRTKNKRQARGLSPNLP